MNVFHRLLVLLIACRSLAVIVAACVSSFAAPVFGRLVPFATQFQHVCSYKVQVLLEMQCMGHLLHALLMGYCCQFNNLRTTIVAYMQATLWMYTQGSKPSLFYMSAWRVSSI